MPGPAYRGFRIILGIFSALTAIAGLVVILSGKPLLRLAPCYGLMSAVLAAAMVAVMEQDRQFGNCRL